MQKTSSCNTKISNLYIENKYHHLTLQKNSHYFWTRVYIIHQNNPVSKSLRYIITWFLPSRSYRCRAPRYRRHASSYRRHPIKLPSSVISDNFAYRRIAANLWWIIVQKREKSKSLSFWCKVYPASCKVYHASVFLCCKFGRDRWSQRSASRQKFSKGAAAILTTVVSRGCPQCECVFPGAKQASQTSQALVSPKRIRSISDFS